MEDKKFQELFSKFQPQIGDDRNFIHSLEKRLDGVEIIREHNERMVRNARLSMIAAAAVGFICGFLFSLAIPYIGRVAAHLQATTPQNSFISMVALNYYTLSWVTIAAFTIILSMNTYHLCMAKAFSWRKE